MKDKKLRIGLFTDVYYPSTSGVVIAVDTLKRALEAKGHKVFIITMNNEPKSHKYIRKNNCIKIPGIPTHIYDYSIRITYPIKAVNMIKSLNLDVIHAHTEFGMGIFAKSMAKKLDIPMIHTYHTLYDLSLDYITKGYFPNVSKKILKTYMNFYFSNVINQIIVPSEKTKNSLSNFYKIKPNVNVIPNGLDIEKFNYKKIKKQDVNKLKEIYNIKENDFISMWVGRLGYEKRIDILIDGYSDVVKDNPNAKLFIIGTGPEEDKLKELVHQKRLENNCIFLGKIDYEMIPLYYQLASIVVTASHYETQGLTVIEAFASKTPVVCIEDDSFKDVVINNYNGLTFRTKKEYSKKIKYLIENPDKLKEMSNNAYIFAQKYSLNSFASSVTNVYMMAQEEHRINSKN